MTDIPHFHLLKSCTPAPARMNNPFSYVPHPLALEAVKETEKAIATLNLTEGKMFGVLCAAAVDGRRGFLAAYSGQIDGISEVADRFFVPPAFNYLEPDGYFLQHEREIEQISRNIERLQHSAEYAAARSRLAAVKDKCEQAVADARQRMKEAKERRDARRQQGSLTTAEAAAMTRESQFLKAELHRVKVRCREKLHEAEEAAAACEQHITELRTARKLKSDRLQAWLFNHFTLLNARGETMSLTGIWQRWATLARRGVSLPPSGSGECCEPKLLQYAYRNGLRPLCMAMFWWGPSPKTEVRLHKTFYPACQGKCRPLLTWMLHGLDTEPEKDVDAAGKLKVIYSDNDIAVIDKPQGMPSVPGNNGKKSVKDVLMEVFPAAEGPVIVHRLDMDTGGLMVAALTKDAYRNLQQQFAARTVRKQYTAVTALRDIPPCGTISLPLTADDADRPRQKVDRNHGRSAITTYRVISRDEEKDEMTLALWPHTGRTHQLRVHCAHHDGLNAPIKGDRLYGSGMTASTPTRLCLHAARLEFTHPVTGRRMHFTSEPEWTQ